MRFSTLAEEASAKSDLLNAIVKGRAQAASGKQTTLGGRQAGLVQFDPFAAAFRVTQQLKRGGGDDSAARDLWARASSQRLSNLSRSPPNRKLLS